MISCSLVDLLKNQAPDAELRSAIIELTPESFNQSDFNTLVDAMRSLLDPSFAELSEIGMNGIDCCGTGGSGIARFNTSTTVAYILAACGEPVVKFGNRAASGKSGSSDVLEKLGIPLVINPRDAADLLKEGKLLFLFAPQAYPILARLGPIRKSLGVTTALNFIGPLLNPTNPSYRLMGVSNPKMAKLITGYLASDPHTQRAAIVTSDCGLDEVCSGCTTDVSIVEAGAVRHLRLDPLADGVCQSNLTEVFDATNNAQRMRDLFKYASADKNITAIVAANAGLSLHLMNRAENIAEGIAISLRALQDGKVQTKLEEIERLYAK